MKKFLQLVISLILTCALGGMMVACSDDDPTETYPKDNGSLEPQDPEGELLVSQSYFDVRDANDRVDLYVTYKAGNGLYMPNLITIEPAAEKEIIDGDIKCFRLAIGKYTVKAEKLSRSVEVRVISKN